jgi:hypothetical protein
MGINKDFTVVSTNYDKCFFKGDDPYRTKTPSGDTANGATREAGLWGDASAGSLGNLKYVVRLPTDSEDTRKYTSER